MFSAWLHESNQTSENLPSCRSKLHDSSSMWKISVLNLVMLKLQPATGALVVSVCKNKLNLPRLQKKREKEKSRWNARSPVAVSHHISAQPLGQVSSDPVQLLWSRHSVEGQLLHVWFTEAILQQNTRPATFTGLKTSSLINKNRVCVTVWHLFSLSAVELHC